MKLNVLSAMVIVTLGFVGVVAAALPTPPEIWKDYDPDKGDFKEELVKEATADGNYYRESYISAYVNGEEVRIYCLYKVKAGARNAPGLLNVHGWMSAASIDHDFVKDGWACMSYDYCGKSGNRINCTNRFSNKPGLKDWTGVSKLGFTPKPGSDLTKVIFAEFKWVK